MSEDYYRWRPHPWHGLETGPNPPFLIHAFIEITPFDLFKYEVDKTSGYLKVDRPNPTSALCPVMYGFIPRTYCSARVAKLAQGATVGDEDPLDVCVISERNLNKSEVVVSARVIGGLQLIDAGEADDKIFAVIKDDSVWSHVIDTAQMPESFLNRIVHYFSTYKASPGQKPTTEVGKVYGRDHAERVVSAAMEDYLTTFGAGPSRPLGMG